MATIWIPDLLYRYSPAIYLLFALVMLTQSNMSVLGLLQFSIGVTSLLWSVWVISHRTFHQRLGW